MGTWIDYKQLRESLKAEDLLHAYHIDLKIKGDRATGFCPLPTHEGKGRSPSFSVDLRRGLFKCFGCNIGGGLLDLAVRMEGFDPSDSAEFRQGALNARERLGLGDAPATPVKTVAKRNSPLPPARKGKPATSTTAKPVSTPPKVDLPILVNAPLDFELRELDPGHPYLKERGFTDETIRHFGLGYCNRGMLKGRVAIPLHDPQGRLLGYAGRLTIDADVNEANPKYRLPGEREHKGALHRFEKSKLLYNAHRIKNRGQGIIVVEGFPGVWWLAQHGFMETVALMGSDCSPEQAKLILEKVDLDGRIWIMPDGDDAGRRCAQQLLQELSPYRFVRWVKLDEGEQPTDQTMDAMQAMLTM